MRPLFHSLLAYVLLASALQRSPWALAEPVSLLLIVMAMLVAAAGSCWPRRPFLQMAVWCAFSVVTVVELVLIYGAPIDRVPSAVRAQRDAWAMYEPLSMMLVIAVLLAAIGATWRSMRRPLPERVASIAVGVFTLVELGFLYLSPTEYLSLSKGLLLIIVGCVVVSYGWGGMPGGRYRFPIIVGLYLLVGGGMVHEWKPPPIDVWHFQQEAAGHLLADENPYASEYGNPPANPQFYGPDMVKNGKVQSFPYPPLSLLLALPGYLEGDVRWSLLIATAAAACFMTATARRLGLPPGHPAEIAAAAILYHPRGLFVLQMAWTEPFLLLAICVSAWAIAGRRQTLSGFALAAAATVKQYGLLWILPAWTTGRLHWRKMIPGAVAAGLVMLPFVLWDPKAFWRGTVYFQISGPFRPDSLTVLSAVYLLTGTRLPSALGFIAAILMTWLVLRRPTKDLASAVLGEAAILLAFFAFNKVGDMNYYWLINAVLALAIVVSAADARSAETKAQG